MKTEKKAEIILLMVQGNKDYTQEYMIELITKVIEEK